MIEKKNKGLPFLLFSFNDMKRIGQKLRNIGISLARSKPGLAMHLKGVDAEVEDYEYAAACFVSAALYGLIIFMLIYAIIRLTDPTLVDVALVLSLLIGFVFFLMFLTLHLGYPAIMEKKIVEKENKDLLFALREIIMSTESGVNLYDAMRHVATGNYGHISKDFSGVIRRIDAGVIEQEALKALAIENENIYLRRASWQIVTALETGTRVGEALRAITDLLEKDLYRSIRAYSANLSFLSLIYSLIAAAIPSIGITFLIILAAIGGAPITSGIIIALVVAVLIVEVIIIGYGNSTRPELFGG